MSVKDSLSRTVGRIAFTGQKFAPEILTGVGIVGFVAAGVIAARQTLKLEEVTNHFQHEIAGTKAVEHDSPKDLQKALTKVYIKGAGSYVKLYGPSVTLAIGSAVCIGGGQHLLRKRNVALAAAYKALETTFHKYRERVVEELGEEKERELRLGLRAVSGVDDDGVVTNAQISDPIGISPYAKIFDRDNVNWNENQDYNLLFLKAQQNYWNDYLKARGHVFLNEVYASLGLEHSEEGAVTGWLYGKDGVDNNIDFGIFDRENIRNGAYLDGTEGHVFLDFNVDGLIYNKIGKNRIR